MRHAVFLAGKAALATIFDARPDVSDGPKRLYAQLFRIAVTTDRRKYPWLGYIYASEWFLAGQVGRAC